MPIGAVAISVRSSWMAVFGIENRSRNGNYGTCPARAPRADVFAQPTARPAHRDRVARIRAVALFVFDPLTADVYRIWSPRGVSQSVAIHPPRQRHLDGAAMANLAGQSMPRTAHGIDLTLPPCSAGTS
jgi:hypothetical protein